MYQYDDSAKNEERIKQSIFTPEKDELDFARQTEECKYISIDELKSWTKRVDDIPKDDLTNQPQEYIDTLLGLAHKIGDKLSEV